MKKRNSKEKFLGKREQLTENMKKEGRKEGLRCHDGYLVIWFNYTLAKRKSGLLRVPCSDTGIHFQCTWALYAFLVAQAFASDMCLCESGLSHLGTVGMVQFHVGNEKVGPGVCLPVTQAFTFGGRPLACGLWFHCVFHCVWIVVPLRVKVRDKWH